MTTIGEPIPAELCMNETICKFITPQRQMDVWSKEPSFSLPELQEAVGGYIQIIPLTDNLILVCNEDGINLRLPLNGLAMREAARLTGEPGHPIYGNVVLCEKGMVE